MGRKLKLPRHVHGFVDRQGKPRYYLRQPGHKKSIPLPGLPWSPVFMTAYDSALTSEVRPQVAIGASRTRPGTLNAAVVGFYDSAGFQQHGEAYRTRHRQVLDKFRQETGEGNSVPRGERQLRSLTGEALGKIVGKVESPNMQRHLIKALRNLMKFAAASNLIDVDPSRDPRAKRIPKTGGFKPWEESDIAGYRAHHPLGTTSRLALEIMLNTGLRRSDAVLLGRQHLRDGKFVMKPKKTENVTGVVVKIPVHPDLQAAIDAMPARQVKP